MLQKNSACQRSDLGNSLQAALTTSAGEMRCAAAVLHPEWVVVAAHCVNFDMEDMIVRSGARSSGGAMRNCTISRVVMHPGFNQVSHGKMLYSAQS